MTIYKSTTHLSNFNFANEWSGDPIRELGEFNGEWYSAIPDTFPLPTHSEETLEVVTMTQEILTGLLNNTSKTVIDPNFVFLSTITIGS